MSTKILAVNDAAPEFALPDQDGKRVRLSDLRGRWVAMWWYPEASSGTCSIQGDGFCAIERDFAGLGAEVLGVSFDDPAKNREFATSHGFGFRLLSDVDRSVAAMYRALREPGDIYERYPRRISYLIDPDGRIAMAYVIEEGDARSMQDSRRMLDDLRSLAASRSTKAK